MGQRGPAKTPTALALVRGERKDRINTNEPKPSSLEIATPEWLSDEACGVWATLAPDLEAKGVLTTWDVETFACWCDAAVRRRSAVAHLRVEGEIVELPVFNKNGEQTGHRMAKNPWTFVLNEADAQLQKYAARFGLTPSDRAGLSIGKGSADADDDLLTG